MRKTSSVKLVVFDWTGTLIDHGSVAPVQALITVFAGAGIAVTAAQVRSAGAATRREQIAALLRVPDVLRTFQRAQGREPTCGDIDQLYAAYMPAQIKAIQRFGELI